MKVLYATSEALPFAASGGLADVAGSLPKALRTRLIGCRVVLPLYESVSPAIAGQHDLPDQPVGAGGLAPPVLRRVRGQIQRGDLLPAGQPVLFQTPRTVRPLRRCGAVCLPVPGGAGDAATISISIPTSFTPTTGRPPWSRCTTGCSTDQREGYENMKTVYHHPQHPVPGQIRHGDPGGRVRHSPVGQEHW